MIVILFLAAVLNVEIWSTDCGAGLLLPGVGGYWMENAECRKGAENA